jgi:hypothetical protein
MTILKRSLPILARTSSGDMYQFGGHVSVRGTCDIYINLSECGPELEVTQVSTTGRSICTGLHSGKRAISTSGCGGAVVLNKIELSSHDCRYYHIWSELCYSPLRREECDVMRYTDSYDAIRSVPTGRDSATCDNPDTGESLHGSATR